MKELLPGVGNIYITFLKVLTGVLYLPFKVFFVLFFFCFFCFFKGRKEKGVEVGEKMMEMLEQFGFSPELGTSIKDIRKAKKPPKNPVSKYVRETPPFQKH